MLFFENLSIFLEGIGLAYCSDSFLPADPLFWSQNLDGLFELTLVPFMVPWPRCVRCSPELQSYKDIVRHAVLGPEVPLIAMSYSPEASLLICQKALFFTYP